SQSVVTRYSHQIHDAACLIFGEGNVRYAAETELFRTAITFEAVEQEPVFRRVYAFERFFNAALCDGRHQARFASVVAQAIALIAQVQTRQFHVFAHPSPPTAGARAENAERIQCECAWRCCVVSLPAEAATGPPGG